MPDEPSHKPLPRCKAMLLCERVIIERGTEQPHVIGIVDRIALPQYPGSLPDLTLFVQLTDGIGRYHLVVELLDLEAGEVIAQVTEGPLRFVERLERVNLGIALAGLELRHPGSYDLVVLADGYEIDRQQFIAMTTEEPTDEE